MSQSKFTPQENQIYTTEQPERFIQIETVTQVAKGEYFIEYIEMTPHLSTGKLFGYLHGHYLYKIIWQYGYTLFAREENFYCNVIHKIGE